MEKLSKPSEEDLESAKIYASWMTGKFCNPHELKNALYWEKNILTLIQYCKWLETFVSGIKGPSPAPVFLEGSSNGRTGVFEAPNEGSIPSPSADIPKDAEGQPTEGPPDYQPLISIVCPGCGTIHIGLTNFVLQKVSDKFTYRCEQCKKAFTKQDVRYANMGIEDHYPQFRDGELMSSTS